jgi:hypothetical protein
VIMHAVFITDPVPPARQVGDFHLYLNFTTDVLQRAKPFFDLLYSRITGKELPRSKSTVRLIRCMCEALIGAGARLRDGLEDLLMPIASTNAAASLLLRLIFHYAPFVCLAYNACVVDETLAPAERWADRGVLCIPLLTEC